MREFCFEKNLGSSPLYGESVMREFRTIKILNRRIKNKMTEIYNN